FDKVVKNACKPKNAPPKAKYLDPIIAATWSDDGSVHDVCKALAPRLREPNAIVVFKALIVLHTMIRNGATDNVLQYLSSSDVLRLKNVGATQWEGVRFPPENLKNYALYLDARIRAFRELKHDAIRVQSETNRDLRLKTIMGRKLRTMTVEKGLLRETRIVQKMIDALVECQFYVDDLEDELNIAALRMLVKDLLILFQAGNEGVINVLEHYFEMSHVDATQALQIYRHFCKQTEHVVEYLSVAKKLQNLLNVSIPNLKHAPVSLVKSLEEYLNDPNFEQNRIEYKANKDAADRSVRDAAADAAPSSVSTSSPAASSSAPKPEANKAIADFFSAIEEQPTMFNPNTNSPTSNYFVQQAAFNPFHPQATALGSGISSQPTGAPSLFGQSTGATSFSGTGAPSLFSQPTGAGSLFGQSTGATSLSGSTSPLSSQPTGFSGLKAFKPTSSFGASLLESL
ncbi:ANTH domain-containing protein, partial [Vararia minispora EC-137]